jgi:hypothetical protein
LWCKRSVHAYARTTFANFTWSHTRTECCGLARMEYFLNLRSESNQFTWATLRVKLSFELALLVRACVCLQGVGWYHSFPRRVGLCLPVPVPCFGLEWSRNAQNVVVVGDARGTAVIFSVDKDAGTPCSIVTAVQLCLSPLSNHGCWLS